MSGPKDYCPPPQYSMQVFDGKLNSVFQLQIRLKKVCSEIEGLNIADSKLGIHFNCLHELNKIRNQIDIALKSPVFDYKGTFGQDTKNRIAGEIDVKIADLLNILNECEGIKNEFFEKKAVVFN